jgi:hypothetical protein
MGRKEEEARRKDFDGLKKEVGQMAGWAEERLRARWAARLLAG